MNTTAEEIKLNDLNKYFPPKTAGHLMTEKFPVAKETSTIREIKEEILKNISAFDSIDYVYITDHEKKLRGVTSLKEIFSVENENNHIKKIMVAGENLITVRPHTGQQRTALLAVEHNIKAVPVTDHEEKFLGVVPSDTILKIVDNEAVEDILRFGGVFHSGIFDNGLNITLKKSLKHRLPWLIIGLLGGLFMSYAINSFEDMISGKIILAGFIPLIVYMASATGTQTQAFIIRDLTATKKFPFIPYLIKQTWITSAIALINSVALTGAICIFYNDATLSFTIGAALFIAMLSSIITGMVIPYVFFKINLDPANASGPIGTVIQDILSVLVYFWILTILK